jgi:hypothetical protein
VRTSARQRAAVTAAKYGGGGGGAGAAFAVVLAGVPVGWIWRRLRA